LKVRVQSFAVQAFKIVLVVVLVLVLVLEIEKG
jgi:hypothetical protein